MVRDVNKGFKTTGVHWSKEQLDIFDAVKYGRQHIFVVSSAGSGKTTTALGALNHTPAEAKVLFLAFSKPIQEELVARAPRRANVVTYHKFGFDALKRMVGHNIQVDKFKVEKVLREIVPSKHFKKGKHTLISLVSLCKSYLATTPQDILDLAIDHGILVYNPQVFVDKIAEWIVPTLEACKQDLSTVDFDDMCWLPSVLGAPIQTYDYVFVDEVQDTGANQVDLLSKAVGKSGRLIAIGDPHQCQPGETKVLVNRLPGETHSVDLKDVMEGDQIVTYDRHAACFVQNGRVNKVASRPYAGKLYSVTAGGKTTRCTPNHKWLVKWNKKGQTNVFKTAACNLIPEHMQILVSPNGLARKSWMPVTVSVEEYDGTVYSLDVDKYHTYVADGLVTCNSIYGFRGAATDAVDNLIKKFRAKVLAMPVTYRCAREIVKKAKEIVPMIEPAPNAAEGEVNLHYTYDNMLADVRDGDMVLCRTMAPLLEPCLALIRNGVKAFVRGTENDAKEMKRLLGEFNSISISGLRQQLFAYQDEQARFYMGLDQPDKAQQVIDLVESVCALMSGLTYVGEINKRIDSIFSDALSGVIFSTVHRAKGLEADTVWIIRPDLMPHKAAKPGWEQEQEKNLQYVAYTRAKSVMNIVTSGYPKSSRKLVAKRGTSHDILNQPSDDEEDEG